MNKKLANLARGDAVEIKRDPSAPWEPATYLSRANDWRGWHRVELPASAKPRYINVMTGMEVEIDDPDRVESRTLFVPSRRIRPGIAKAP